MIGTVSGILMPDPRPAPALSSTAASTRDRCWPSTWTRSRSRAGVRAAREVVRHGARSRPCPCTTDGRVVLIRQYRYAVDALVWEIPAGRLDPGETPERGRAAASSRRRWACRPAHLEPISTFYTTPGFCDETMHLFRATGLDEVPARPEADERIEARVFTLDEAREMVRRGEVREGKTLVALLLEAERRREPR